MNEIQRSVLLKYGPDIVKNVIVNESLLGALYYRGVFKEEMMDMVRVCQLPVEKMYKVLELIQKCGPDAFDGFVDTLEENYDWLAKSMKESIALETEEILVPQVQTQEVQTPRKTSISITLDSDIKARVSGFVQKQFGSVRKISMSDKKQIESWIGEWLQQERKRLTDVFDQAASDVFENPQIKERLWTIYKQICDRNKKSLKKKSIQTESKNISCEQKTDIAMETENHVDLGVYDMSFKLIEEELNKTIDRLAYLEQQISESYQYMGFPKTHSQEMSLVVHDLCRDYKLKERELVKEKEKIETMLEELYQYSKLKNKMQNDIHYQDHHIRTLEEQISDMANENKGLQAEIEILERQLHIHLEKEKTLTELRNTTEELQSMLNDEKLKNEELRKSMKDFKSPLSRLYQNRKGTSQNSNNTGNKTVQPPKVPLKRNPPKKKSQSFRA